jgi:fucose 4-O-acetylase-like acetyltransferase
MTGSKAVSKKIRLTHIDKLTGIAITLVVIGHLETGPYLDCAGLEWYKFLKKFIYSFPMPLFMFLSGYVWSYTVPEINNTKEYLSYIKKKFFRLMPSYFIFAGLILLGKLFFIKYFFINNPVQDFSEFWEVIYKPTASYAGFLWYVYVLFEYYLFFPILLFLFKNKIDLILLATIPFLFIEITDFFAINFFLHFLFFFSLGILAERRSEQYLKMIDGYSTVFLFFFFMACCVFFIFPIPKFIMGCLSIPALHTFVRNYLNDKSGLFKTIGFFSFSIYLMNVPVTGIIKAVSFMFLGVTYANFYLLAFFMVICGIVLPVLIKKYIINRIPIIQSCIG